MIETQPSPSGTRLIPASMLNAWTYCPRLAYLQWVEGERRRTAELEDGRRVHRGVDAGGGQLPRPDTDAAALPFETRSTTLSSFRLGVIARMDVIEGEGRRAVPVELKRRKRPHVPRGAYEPERVQVCAHAMLLEDAGYDVPEGVLWFAGSNERVRVELDDELRRRTMDAIRGLRLAAERGRRPAPLEDSPKCPRCSLASICLPDEVNFFRRPGSPRLLTPAVDSALPVHIQDPGSVVKKGGGRLMVVDSEGKATSIPMADVSEVNLYGQVSITTPTVAALLRQDATISWHTTGGWFLGHARSSGRRSLDTRRAQFHLAEDSQFCQKVANGLVSAKIMNQRTLLRRNWKADAGESSGLEQTLRRLRLLARRAKRREESAQLLGTEGEAAALYFGEFRHLISRRRVLAGEFEWQSRHRRPPTDPVNALLSYIYGVAVRHFTVALEAVGFDPLLGFFHRPRPGRPSLALDMMEPFRPILCDSTVLTAINNAEVRDHDFVRNGVHCALKPRARKALIAAWERRLSQETTHPVFGYRVNMRRLIGVQCRLLARHVLGEIPEMPHYTPR